MVVVDQLEEAEEEVAINTLGLQKREKAAGERSSLMIILKWV